MKKISLLTKIINSRLLWAAVSLLVSFALWIYIASVETDEYPVELRGVRVEFTGEDTLLAKNFMITDLDTGTVNLRVSGPRRITTSLRAEDLVARVDVSKLTQPAFTSQQYTVVFPSSVNSGDLTVTRRSPDTVNFMVSNIVTNTVPVRGSFDGETAEGVVAESPSFEPSVIEVTGPEVYLRDVDCAWVSFGQGETVSSTYSVEAPFTLLNADREPCSIEYLSFSQETVRATLPVQETKTVPLTVDVIWGNSATEANTKISIDPATVKLAGDSALLAGINRISLATIDLTDFTTTFSDTYTIPLPNDLKNLTGVTEATVSIEIVGTETRNFSVTNISCINATEGTQVEILTESITVRLRGTPEALDQIKSENIRAVADLKDYVESTGTFMPTVQIYPDGSTAVDLIGEAADYVISVDIRKAEP